MKKFDRFPHSGVMKDLVMLKKALGRLGDYEFGSSGESQITARSSTMTAYARKFKMKDGWKLEIWKNGKVIQTSHPDSCELVVKTIRRYK